MRKDFFYFGLVAIFLLVFVAGCGTVTRPSNSEAQALQQTAPRVDAPKFNIGDSWKFTSGTSMEIKQVLDNRLIVERHGKGSPQECGDVILERDFNCTTLAVRSLTGELLTKCELANGWKYLDFPIYLMKEWEFKADGMSARLGTVCSYINKMKVIAYEEVSLPCGIVKAFKIHHRQQNLCGTTNRPWYTQGYYWYSPDIKAVVQVMDSNSKMTNQVESYRFK